MTGGWGWAGLSEEDMMRGGGGVAKVMRVEHARSPLCCTPMKETWRKDGKMGGEEECSTTCCCWTWHTEPASAGGALWWPAAFSTHAAERKQGLDQSSETGRHESSCVNTTVISHQSLTCCAPLSLLSVRSSSECDAQTSCSAARSRDRSVLKCSVASGRSGTFYKHNRCLFEHVYEARIKFCMADF